VVAVARQPDRQQQVLERHAEVLRIHLVEPLMVAADVLAAELPDRPVHDRPRDAETLLQPDRVALRREPAQELRLERLDLLEVPRL
jgi:hypothetical protein